MRERVWFRAATMVAGIACGCGSAGGGGGDGGGAGNGGGGDGGGGTSLQTFCARVQATLVARDAECLGEPMAASAALDNLDPCAAWTSAAVAGTMEFDATNADACLAALEALPCTGLVPSICLGVLGGRLPPGATCNAGRDILVYSECAGDAQCMVGGTGTCDGTCVTRAADGNSCGEGQPCVLTDECDGRTGRCAPLPREGETCGVTSLFPCAEGLYCSDAINGGTCQPRHASGTCSNPDECVEPAVCNVSSLQPTSTCEAPPPPGAGCAPGSTTCGNFMYCGSDDTCHPPSGIGQPCSDTGAGPYCIVGLCTGGICTAIAEGQVCAGNPHCGPNTLCTVRSGDTMGRCTSRCF
jgi:hypothetical protein